MPLHKAGDLSFLGFVYPLLLPSTHLLAIYKPCIPSHDVKHMEIRTPTYLLGELGGLGKTLSVIPTLSPLQLPTNARGI
jgi:hypothetical protein